MKIEAFADLVSTTQKRLGKAHFDNLNCQLSWLGKRQIEEMARQLDTYVRVFPKRTGDIHLPILEPDKAMTVKQLIEKLSALDGDLKVYIRYDAGCDSGSGTWIDDIADTDKYEVLDMESHVVIDVT